MKNLLTAAQFGVEPYRPTFINLYNFTQIAERDDQGYHKIDNTVYAFHIYEGRRQVNMCMKDGMGHFVSIGNFVFKASGEPSTCDEVTVYSVEKGVCDYGNGHKFKISTSLDAALPIKHGARVSGFLQDSIHYFNETLERYLESR